MEYNFEPRIVEKSHFLRATIIYQWIYAFFGLALPPPLAQNVTSSSIGRLLLWPFFILYVAVLIVLVIWMVYVNNLVVYTYVDHYALDSITSVLSIVQNIAVAFVQITMHLVAFVGRQRSERIQKTIAQLERDIGWYSRDFSNHFGVFREEDINFRQKVMAFHRKLFLRCGLFLLVHCTLLSYVNYPLISDILSLRDRILTVLSFQLIQTKYSEYCASILIVNEFVSSLQQSLRVLRYEIIRGQRLEGNFPAYGKLMANQFLLSRVWILVQYIEDYFGLPMLILFLYNGVAITHTINWMYVRSFALDEKDSLEGCEYRSSFYMENFEYSMKISSPPQFVSISFSWYSFACFGPAGSPRNYSQISSILSSFKIPPRDVALKNRQREYSLQLLHQKLEFSCWGFFDMNLKYFGLVGGQFLVRNLILNLSSFQMALAVTTYVFILIQFKLQAETEKGNLRL
uniref:Gustatory receptor n=1 Tax=Musca domestica TaxID=7370 RepID=A0A1I8MYD4_MUSDO